VNRRIALWMFAGLRVAGGWWLYVVSTAPTPLTMEPVLWTLARYSCPIVLAGVYFHFGVSIYLVLVVNAGTYGLLGLIVEAFRPKHAR
jgi:hypothetical protein